MPEGDTVHKVAAVLRAGLEGRDLARVELRDYPRLATWAGRTVTGVEAIGKHFLFTIGSDMLRVHLGMHGAWHRNPRFRSRDTRVVLATEQDTFVCIQAVDVEPFPAKDRARHPVLSTLGPDLLGPDEPDWHHVWTRVTELCPPELEITDLLLDQRVACGLGNVYKSELCFLGPLQDDPFTPSRGIHPKRAWSTISQPELTAIFQRGRLLLQANLGGWPRTTLRDPRLVRDFPRGRLWVYGRTRKPCFLCGTPILGEYTGDHVRSTQWCPTCQSPTRK